MSRIRIYLADDHPVLRSGLRLLLGRQPDLEVIGEGSSGEEALRAVRDAAPDVVLMDLSMPGGGAGGVARICAAATGTRVLVLTMYDDPAYARAALRAGAAGFLVKTAADTELLAAIRAVYQGRTVVEVKPHGGEPPLTAPSFRDGATRVRISAREGEVLGYLGRGFTNREIAERIGLSVKTVETYRSRLAHKLGLRRRADFVEYAAKAGLPGAAGAGPDAESKFPS